MKNIALIAAAAAVGFVSTAAQAAQFSDDFDASVEILAALNITQNTALSFGTVDLANGVESTFTVSPTGAAPTVTGSGASFIVAPTAGAFTVTGSDRTVNLSESTGNCSNTNVQLTDISLSSLTAAITNGSATFSVGGTVSIPAGTTAGLVTCSYTLTANY